MVVIANAIQSVRRNIGMGTSGAAGGGGGVAGPPRGRRPGAGVGREVGRLPGLAGFGFAAGLGAGMVGSAGENVGVP